jgi:ELWxxDGT repeat protein
MFAATDVKHGTELWAAPSSCCTPGLVKDIWKGTSSSSPSNLATIGSRLYFAADDGVHGKELWVNTGLSVNTYLLKDIA